jgi:hypothetical protein
VLGQLAAVTGGLTYGGVAWCCRGQGRDKSLQQLLEKLKALGTRGLPLGLDNGYAAWPAPDTAKHTMR